MAPVTKSVELPNQVRLPYVEQGDPSGVPVLLVHAIADSWHAFEPVLPHLPDSFRAFALTQRGHGDASHPAAGYHPHDFAADLVAFMDALHLEAAVIAGGSSGGFIARRFAIDHPERTLGLVLIGSPFSLRDKPGVQEIWDSTLSKLTDPVDPAFVRDFVESTLARPVPRGFFETLVQESLKVPARVWKATMEGLLEDESYGELDKIKAPTLIVWGDQDAIIPRTDQETLAAAIADSRLVVYPGGRARVLLGGARAHSVRSRRLHRPPRELRARGRRTPSAKSAGMCRQKGVERIGRYSNAKLRRGLLALI